MLTSFLPFKPIGVVLALLDVVDVFGFVPVPAGPLVCALPEPVLGHGGATAGVIDATASATHADRPTHRT
jgi:hypothetical protein